MKKAIYIVITTIVLTGIIAGSYFYKQAKHLTTYHSPCGKYELIVNRASFINLGTMPGDGGAGSRIVEVILKSADGKTIGATKRNTVCETILDSILVQWDYENNWVWYGKGKAIDLKTGEDGC